VSGANLAPGTLRDQFAGEGPTLLAFLRHFGCVFCREMVSELRRASEADPKFPKVVFVYQGTPTEGRAFLRRYWPRACGVSDPEREIYDAFGIGRLSRLQLLRPALWSAQRRARAKGIEQGPPDGDVWRMPGLFLVEDGHVVWEHTFHHAGDHPDFARIPERARGGA
jgi:hypothetical protein